MLNETMPAVQPKAKMIPALQVCQLMIRLAALNRTYQDDIREREEEKRPGIMSATYASSSIDRTHLLKYCQ